MALRPLAAAIVLLALVLAACDQGTVIQPSARDGPGSTSGASDEPAAEATPPVVGQLLGTWRRSPVVLDDRHVAIFSDACATKARVELSASAGDLPTAVVDAQGMAFGIVILADDMSAVVCDLDIDPAGEAIASSAEWLAGEEIAGVEGTGMSVVSYLHAMDGGRTVAFGRIGPDGIKAKITFDDASVIQAASTNGWWATWWRGVVPAATFVTTDSKDIVIGHAAKPPEAVDTGVSLGPWWIDPGKPAPTATSTTIHALVTESTCSSGEPPVGRVGQPLIEVTDARITVTFWVRGPQGPSQTCQGADPAPIELVLPEPLGKRKLLDGSSDPPRDATKRPD